MDSPTQTHNHWSSMFYNASPFWALLALILVGALVYLWFKADTQVILRSDMSIDTKTLWRMAIGLMPGIGPIIYFLVQPAPDEE